jgi:hypothetical protein
MKNLQQLKSNYTLFIILIIGLILRFYNIDYQSIWLDEIHTMNESNPETKLSELYDAIMTGEQMPPLYFYILYFIFKVFGYTTFVARLFSAILGILSIYGIYILGKELINKKVGLISALILTINPFHLYFSQEARPYILLFLFSIFSFFYLIKLIKQTHIKNSIYYGVFTGLMLISHFFGLFILLSQLFILLFFLIINEGEKKIRFFKLSFLAGFIIIALFLPALEIFIKTTEIKEFWIPAPTLDTYTLIFKEFFGNSEMVLTLLSVFVLFYFFNLSKEKKTIIKYSEIIDNKLVFSFIIFLPWISIVLLVPLIRSYLSVPMIISRYFIVILPAIILIISIGLFQFKNKIILSGFVLLLFIFSLTDIFIVKKYYSEPNKAQFRDVSSFINDNSAKEEKIYTTLSWYFQYFIKKQKLIDKPINQLFDEIKSDTSELYPFWYTNAHGNKFELSNENEQFINKNFVIDKSYEGFDAWAKRFIPKKMFTPKVSIQKFKPYNKIYYGNKIKVWIENFDLKKDSLFVSGWSILEKVESNNSNIFIVVFDSDSEYVFLTSKINRPDITKVENDSYDYNNSGFMLKADLNEIGKGTYQLGVFILNDKKEGFYITEKEIHLD